MAKQDFDTAEKHLKRSNDLGSAMPEAEGAKFIQNARPWVWLQIAAQILYHLN
jgi:hypothetical protein